VLAPQCNNVISARRRQKSEDVDSRPLRVTAQFAFLCHRSPVSCDLIAWSLAKKKNHNYDIKQSARIKWQSRGQTLSPADTSKTSITERKESFCEKRDAVSFEDRVSISVAGLRVGTAWLWPVHLVMFVPYDARSSVCKLEASGSIGVLVETTGGSLRTERGSAITR